MSAMKALSIASTLVLLGASAANAGSILGNLLNGNGRRFKVEDCGTDTCGTISWGKQKFVVKRSDLPAVFKDLDIGNKVVKERDTASATDDRTKPAEAAPAPYTQDRVVTSSRRDEPAVLRYDDRLPPRAEERPSPTTITKDTVAPVEQNVMIAPVAAPVVSDPESPIGEWITEGGEGRVQIRSCGHALCGVIAAASPDETDRHNPDAGKRDRPLLKLLVLIDMKPTKKDRWEGQTYNPKSGNTYSSNMTLKSGDVLRVEGCVLGGLFCGGQTWTRANDSPRG
jgi:uncharacterized protein (DUF2147 family)